MRISRNCCCCCDCLHSFASSCDNDDGDSDTVKRHDTLNSKEPSIEDGLSKGSSGASFHGGIYACRSARMACQFFMSPGMCSLAVRRQFLLLHALLHIDVRHSPTRP